MSPKEANARPRRRLDPLLVAGLGSLVALLALLAGAVGLAETLLLLGPLAAAPPVLALTEPDWPRTGASGRFALARRLQPPAAVFLVAAFARDPGALALVLAGPWVVLTLCMAGLGLLRLVERGGRGPVDELALDAGLVFVAVGGAWLAVNRVGVYFLGFGEPIAFFTAAHFHFAGFVLPVAAGLAARSLPGRLSRLATLGVVTGVPLVAVGITAAQHLDLPAAESIAAWWLSAAALLVAAQHVRMVEIARGRLNGALALLAGVSLAAGMTLAATYALGRCLATPWLDYATMVRSHAVLNVLGFALPALVFWTRMRRKRLPASPDRPGMRRDRRDALCVLVRGVDRAPRGEEWECAGFAEAAESSSDRDRSDEHLAAIAVETGGSPDHGGPFERAAAAISRFDVFAPRRLAPERGDQPVRWGEVVVCRYRVGWIFDVVLASRVVALHDERGETHGGVRRSGFSYRTLATHPFVGEETFCVEKDPGTGAVRVVIRARARPASPLVRLMLPWVRRHQLRAGREAVERVASRARVLDPCSGAVP